MQAKQPIADNQRWGRLTFKRELDSDKPNSRKVLVECDCGVNRTVELYNLNAGLYNCCGSTKCLNQYKEDLKREIASLEDSLISNQFAKSNQLMKIARLERDLISGKSQDMATLFSLTDEYLK